MHFRHAPEYLFIDNNTRHALNDKMCNCYDEDLLCNSQAFLKDSKSISWPPEKELRSNLCNPTPVSNFYADSFILRPREFFSIGSERHNSSRKAWEVTVNTSETLIMDGKKLLTFVKDFSLGTNLENIRLLKYNYSFNPHKYLSEMKNKSYELAKAVDDFKNYGASGSTLPHNGLNYTILIIVCLLVLERCYTFFIKGKCERKVNAIKGRRACLRRHLVLPKPDNSVHFRKDEAEEVA